MILHSVFFSIKTSCNIIKMLNNKLIHFKRISLTQNSLLLSHSNVALLRITTLQAHTVHKHVLISIHHGFEGH